MPAPLLSLSPWDSRKSGALSRPRGRCPMLWHNLFLELGHKTGPGEGADGIIPQGKKHPSEVQYVLPRVPAWEGAAWIKYWCFGASAVCVGLLGERGGPGGWGGGQWVREPGLPLGYSYSHSGDVFWGVERFSGDPWPHMHPQ